MVSVNRLISYLVHQTCESLAENKTFLKELKEYPAYRNCFMDDEFYLLHCPGTPHEIEKILNNSPNISSLILPAIFSFAPFSQIVDGNTRSLSLNLAITGATNPDWTTPQREEYLFQPLLRPLYAEFMHQIERSGFFITNYGKPYHEYYEVFSTAQSGGKLMELYNDSTDAIELVNLQLTLSRCCEEKIEQLVASK